MMQKYFSRNKNIENKINDFQKLEKLINENQEIYNYIQENNEILLNELDKEVKLTLKLSDKIRYESLLNDEADHLNAFINSCWCRRD